MLEKGHCGSCVEEVTLEARGLAKGLLKQWRWDLIRSRERGLGVGMSGEMPRFAV